MNYQAQFKALLAALTPYNREGFASAVCDTKYATMTTIQEVVKLWNEKLAYKRLTHNSFHDHTGGLTTDMFPLDIMKLFDNQKTLTNIMKKAQKPISIMIATTV